MFTGKMPSITPAQITALVTFVVGQLVAFQWVDSTRQQTLISGGSVVVAAVLKIADAYLRGQRAKAVAANPAAFPQVPKAAQTVTGPPVVGAAQ
jgi:hypothetical protein